MTLHTTIETSVLRKNLLEEEDIKDSFAAQFQRHIDWHEDAIKSNIDREFGEKISNQNYRKVRQEAMRKVAIMAKLLSDNIVKSIGDNKTAA